jgi:hypothetical protein
VNDSPHSTVRHTKAISAFNLSVNSH